jgi:hypothetical protein
MVRNVVVGLDYRNSIHTAGKLLIFCKVAGFLESKDVIMYNNSRHSSLEQGIHTYFQENKSKTFDLILT